MLKYVCVLLLLLAPTMGQNVTSVPGNGTAPAGRVTCDTSSAEGWRRCNYYPNIDRDGEVIQSFKASSQNSCCRKCWSKSECYTWVYNTKNRRCYLQDNSGDFFSSRGYSTGFGYCAYDYE